MIMFKIPIAQIHHFKIPTALSKYQQTLWSVQNTNRPYDHVHDTNLVPQYSKGTRLVLWTPAGAFPKSMPLRRLWGFWYHSNKNQIHDLRHQQVAKSQRVWPRHRLLISRSTTYQLLLKPWTLHSEEDETKDFRRAFPMASMGLGRSIITPWRRLGLLLLRL